MFNHVSHCIQFVTDMVVAKQFYAETLGLKIDQDHGGWVTFKTEGATLALHDGVSGDCPATADAPRTQLSLTVESCDAARQALTDKGVSVSDLTEIGGGYYHFDFHDPFGNALGASGPK